MELRSKQILGTLTLTVCVAVTLVVAPYTFLDPMGLPKLLVLAFLAIISFSLIVPTLKAVIKSEFKTLFILLSLFIFQIVLVIVFSGANIGGQILGVYQRQTGGLTYICLAIILLSSSFVSDYAFVKRFTRVTLIVGAILIVYGNVQYVGLEPFPYVNAYTVNAPIGTFGNADFQSAFMGMIAVVSMSMAFNHSYKKIIRISLAVMSLASLVVVYETLAKQGYLNFVAGASVVVILWFFMTKHKQLAIALSALAIAGGALTFLALINIGPLASFLYKGSLAARGYYWRAAVKMVIDHPFFGVGMDGYGDWYFRSRPKNYYSDGFLSSTNAAHNVYLDFASNGGFPLITLYFAILALVIISIVRVVKRSENFDVYFATLVGAWVAYQTQAIVSINQIGLAIWGWVLSGLIIGYEINTRAKEVSQSVPAKGKRQVAKINRTTQPLSSSALISLFIGILIGALITAPIYFANSRFYSAINANDIKGVESAGKQKPHDPRRLYMLAGIFRNAKLDTKAIEVLREATVEFPDSYELWNLWLTIPTASPSDIANAKAQLKRLDPFNPELK